MRCQNLYNVSRHAVAFRVAFLAAALGLGTVNVQAASPAASAPSEWPRVEPSPTLSPTILNSLGIEFILIPEGTFQMGTNDGYNIEQPVHTVHISKPFYLGKYEVTQRQWQALMGSNPSQLEGDNRPVENVSWEDVQEFTRRLNAQEGHQKYRLPTEAEWEYAARGHDGRTYPWGNRAEPARLNFCDRHCEFSWRDQSADDGYATTAPIGSYPGGQSPFGVHDMAGNVWEWVQDWFGWYVAEVAVDPEGPTRPAIGVTRVIRGGGWNSAPWGCRAVARSSNLPSSRRDFLGFRLLREVP